MKISIITGLILLVVTAFTAQAALSQAQLQNPSGELAPPAPVNLYYNNQEVPGYIFQVNGEPFVLIDSLKELFHYDDMMDSDSGNYMVNNRAVDKYYYGNNLYLDVVDFSSAVNVRPRISGSSIIFVPLNLSPPPSPQVSTPRISVSITGCTVGDNPDPVNNKSYLYTVSLTNQSSTPIPLNHFNFVVLSNGGHWYVSVKDMVYVVVFGENDTPDTLTLDPLRKHVITLTFDLPDTELPKTFIVQRNQKILGSASLVNFESGMRQGK